MRVSTLFINHPTTRFIEHLANMASLPFIIEVCLDEDDRVWVMPHSGSRGIGNASYFIQLAREDMERG